MRDFRNIKTNFHLIKMRQSSLARFGIASGKPSASKEKGAAADATNDAAKEEMKNPGT